MSFSVEPVAETARARIDAFLEAVAPAIGANDKDGEVRAVMSRALDRLRSTAVTISVVGQMKSGKSSLINALTGLGDFLPTEVNPWTAVITNLHFGHPEMPVSGGEFRLFSEDEWRRMIEGDAETRRMTEEFLPGFRSDILEQQVLEMQHNAERRLGALYKLLLGKTHRFNTVTPEVLERYVSAGYDADQKPDSTAGRFSGITKSAAIFLPPGPFRVPVTLSDTPGINDPFLVRDEITTSSFKDADIFIVTLSAHQALGPADVALLKMLSVHRGKRTVIFVNRIDELPDPETDVPELLAALDTRLKRALGQSNYSLLTGSAEWGRLALIGTDAEVAKVTSSRAFARLRPDLPDTVTDPREQIYLASGVPQLADCLSDLIDTGRIRRALTEAATECDAALDMFRKLLASRLGKERSHLVDTDDIPALVAAEHERIRDRVRALTEVGQGFDAVLRHGRSEISAHGETAVKAVSRTIQETISGFVEEEVASLREAMQGQAEQGDAPRWSIDIEGLCRQVEARTVAAYRDARNGVDRILTGHAEALNARLRPISAEMDVSRLLDNLPAEEILPGFKPHSALVEMDFSVERGWRFWRAKTMTPNEAAGTMGKIIAAEMRPAAEALIRTVREALAQRDRAALERLRDLAKAAHLLLDSEAGALRSDEKALSDGDTRERIAQIYGERARRAEATEARIAVIDGVRETLSRDFGDLVAATPDTVALPGKV